jgi:hypothetical protein
VPRTAHFSVERLHAVLTVDLAAHFNSIGLTTPQTLHRGTLNVWGNSLPAEALGSGTATIGGVSFALPPADGSRPDNIRCHGQHLPLPHPLHADWLHLLAASERRCEEILHLHYADGSVDPEWLRVSDFWPARAHFGELPAARSAAMHYPHHRQEGLGGQIWAVRVPVTRRSALSSLRLPDNPALHVFALSVESVR